MNKLSMIIMIVLYTGCGQVGPQGPQGAIGETGPTGSYYVVQFCSGYTPSYPSTFPEVGICINDQLYAVFDQSNGYDYLAEVLPGNYYSEATGAPCSFNVSNNCVVNQLQ